MSRNYQPTNRATLTLEVDLRDIGDNLSPSQAMQLIKAVDLAKADFEFTLDVVKYLVSELEKSWVGGEDPENPFDIVELLKG